MRRVNRLDGQMAVLGNRTMVAGKPNSDRLFVHASRQCLDVFTEAALATYRVCTPSSPYACFALLIGRLAAGVGYIESLEFAGNVRATDPVALDVFATEIIPQFGDAYANPCRGYWCDSSDLLRIEHLANSEGLEILGTAHFHPDWHHIGPPHERGMRLSHRPTLMDTFLIRETGWPVNAICYVERQECKLRSFWGFWAPSSVDESELVELQFRLTD